MSVTAARQPGCSNAGCGISGMVWTRLQSLNYSGERALADALTDAFGLDALTLRSQIICSPARRVL